MNVVTVIPITKGIFKESLTYFSSLPIQPGALVSVPVRNGSADALVVAVAPALLQKSVLKQTDFSLRKVLAVKHPSFFHERCIEACQKTAEHHLTQLGQVLKEFTPKQILEAAESLTTKTAVAKPQTPAQERTTIPERYVIQDEESERVGLYRRIIRQTLAQKKSVIICFPTHTDIERVQENLIKGIEDYSILLHSKLSSDTILTNWKQAQTSPKPVVILLTPLFLSLYRDDTHVYIIEKERSPIYKSAHRPYIDARVYIETIAALSQCKLIVGDSLLRTETYYHLTTGHYLPVNTIKQRNRGSAPYLIVGPEKIPDSKEVSILGEELRSMIEYATKERNHVAIISGRRGLHPITICNDCRHVIACTQCATPLALHDTRDGRAWMCHKCGNLRKAEDICPHCGGWRLALVGFGTEAIAEAIKTCAPNAPFFRIDSDTTPTAKKARDEAKKFFTTPGAILLGTEMALSYLPSEIDYIGLVAIDSLFTIPDFRINEKIISLVIETYTRAKKHFILETKQPEHPLFAYALGGNTNEFFRGELEERQLLNYPPYSTLIKISFTGTQPVALETMKALTKTLHAYKPLVIPNIGSPANHYTISVLLKLAGNLMPPELREILTSLPPAFSIDVDPESIL